MHALLFEMKPRDGHEEHYFRHAAALRPRLEQHDGLIYIDRFKSLVRPGVILSHSMWRDEASLAKWRTDTHHHNSQAAGRNKHFEDYRLRISHVLEHAEKERDMREWSDEGAYSAPDSRTPRFLVIVASKDKPFSDLGEAYLSVNFDDAYVNVIDAGSRSAGREIRASADENPAVEKASLCMVSRDYGMFDRAEAPQYFSPVGGEPHRLRSSGRTA